MDNNNNINNNNKNPAFVIFSWVLVGIFILIITPLLFFALYAIFIKPPEVMDVVRVFAVFLLAVLGLLSFIPIRIISLNRKIWHYQKLNNVDGVEHYSKKLEFFVFMTSLGIVLFVFVCIILWITSYDKYKF